MPCITLPIDAGNRPIIEIGYSAAASLQPAGAPPPKIHWIKAIADTGCTHTSIHADVATAAGLMVLGKGMSMTANGPVTCNLFHGDMFVKIPLPNGQVFEYRFKDRRVAELCTKIPDVDALLGMDLLAIGTFHINGVTKNATWCW